jgi:hypothetical protein
MTILEMYKTTKLGTIEPQNLSVFPINSINFAHNEAFCLYIPRYNDGDRPFGFPSKVVSCKSSIVIKHKCWNSISFHAFSSSVDFLLDTHGFAFF